MLRSRVPDPCAARIRWQLVASSDIMVPVKVNFNASDCIASACRG